MPVLLKYLYLSALIFLFIRTVELKKCKFNFWCNFGFCSKCYYCVEDSDCKINGLEHHFCQDGLIFNFKRCAAQFEVNASCKRDAQCKTNVCTVQPFNHVKHHGLLERNFRIACDTRRRTLLEVL